MSQTRTIEAEPRTARGKGGARAVRRAGRLPAIIYGGEGDPVPISLDRHDLQLEMHRPGFFARLYDVTVNGDAVRALPRDVQVDPVTDVPIHVDFIRYVKGAKLAVSVAVHFVGHDDCDGLRHGGVLNVVRHEVELLCPLDAIPDQVVASVAGLDVGDSIHISDIALPDDVSPTITDRDFTIATIAAPTVSVEPTEEEGEDEEEVEGEEGAEEGAAAEAEEGETTEES